MHYAVPPPTLNLAELKLPPYESSPARPLSDPPTMRELRDEAIRKFIERDFAQTVKFLDRMGEQAPLASNLKELRAWAATYAGLDEQAAQYWSELAADAIQTAPSMLAGWHLLRLGRTREAAVHFARVLQLNPAQGSALHMSGIVSWSEGRLAAAQRMFIQALRAPDAPTETFVAMAALQAETGYFPECVGWLRRMRPPMSPEQGARWLNGPEFARIAREWPDGWRAYLREAGLPEDTGVAESEGNGTEAPPARITDERPAPPEERVLQLSPFTRNPRVRMEQARLYQLRLNLERLRVIEDIAEETTTLGQYETISVQPGR